MEFSQAIYSYSLASDMYLYIAGLTSKGNILYFIKAEFNQICILKQLVYKSVEIKHHKKEFFYRLIKSPGLFHGR